MLCLSQTLVSQAVLSIRSGSLVATTTSPIINPNNLKIEGLFCQDSLDKKKQLILLDQDIREFIPQGIVINDYEALAAQSELPKLKEIINLHFSLMGKQVVTVSKKNMGKVTDYSYETKSLFIQKLYVSMPLMKNFTGGGIMIDRTQINEITPKQIIINDLEQTVPARAAVPA